MGFAFGPVNGLTAVSSFIVLPSSLDRGARGKRATRQTAAPTRRKKTAQGKEISGRPQGHALGHESQNKSSPEGAKDADALYGEFKAKGVKITRAICDQPYGCRDFDVEDCNGYRLCFGKNLDG